MPPSERARIQQLVENEDWASKALAKIRGLAKRDVYWAAFLYALEGDQAALATAKQWLLKYGQRGGDLGKRALKADDAFFEQGQPWLGDVYYKIDHKPLVAFDWIYDALTPEEREAVSSGIVASAKFRMRAMDRWNQTPNLVFKPTFMVALAGLVTGDRELIDWGFERKPGSGTGGYFSVLDAMLKDGGPWAEAPLYPISHKDLLLMLRMSRLLGLRDGKDWFAEKASSGGSPRGLLQYYIDTAYPLEETGFGRGQIRVATYGDGATGPQGDLFLVNPAGPGVDMHEELAEAYGLSGDPAYAGFLSFVPGHAPSLLDRGAWPPPEALPPAPSKIWPEFGVAMLRSDASPAYWTSGEAIAVLQRLTQDYGHGHRDAFGITLHGAGRLLYPDYNYIQYENPAHGWTRNTVAHNTIVVDGKEAQGAKPSVRSDFSPEVKFLATSASGVFAGVDQTRALMLTEEYLLDIFQAGSEAPHTYDYLLHSFGRPSPESPQSFASAASLGPRYKAVQKQRTATADDLWAFSFVVDDEVLRATADREAEIASKRKRRAQKVKYGDAWFNHTATVKVTMAGAPGTQVTYGEGPDGLTVLAARRAGVTDTVFVAAHEPFAGGEAPLIAETHALARSKAAAVARVVAKSFTDYGAVAFGPEPDDALHVLADVGDPNTYFAFEDHGWLRVHDDGSVTARGGWVAFSIAGAQGPVTLNGIKVAARQENGHLVYGTLPRPPDPSFEELPASPVTAKTSPSVIRLLERDARAVSLELTNAQDRPVSGRLVFDLPEGLTIEPAEPAFGPIAPNKTERVLIKVTSGGLKPGPYTLLYRVAYDADGDSEPKLTRPQALKAAIGPVLELVYPQGDGAPVYRIDSRRYVAEADMFSGLVRYLADDDGAARLDGFPLFTFSDGKTPLLFEGTKQAFTWPVETPASLTAHAYDRCRWQAFFFPDRIAFRMDRDWTRFDRAYFTLPGQWVWPARWKSVLTADGALVEAPASGATVKVKAAELEFDGARWNLCFQFLPPQDVTFDDVGLDFSLGSLTKDQWTVGFCPPGSLDQWRWR